MTHFVAILHHIFYIVSIFPRSSLGSTVHLVAYIAPVIPALLVADMLLRTLAGLVDDPVPNVRIGLARLFTQLLTPGASLCALLAR